MSTDLEREAKDKLDNEAAIAATKADCQWNATLSPQTRASYRSGFRDGYRDAATLREKEIAYLNDARSRELQVLVKYLRQIKERDAEIATLRARVAELEGREPKWIWMKAGHPSPEYVALLLEGMDRRNRELS